MNRKKMNMNNNNKYKTVSLSLSKADFIGCDHALTSRPEPCRRAQHDICETTLKT